MRIRTIRMACLAFPQIPGAVLEPLEEALGAHSPAVEWSPEDAARFYLEAAGMGARYGDEGAWCRAVLASAREVLAAASGTAASADAAAIKPRQVRLGLAHTRFGAQLAARMAPSSPGYRIVAEPEARFLADLPLEELPLHPEAVRRLQLFGIRTMGGLAELPAAAAMEQLGPESLLAWQWASGQDARPVVARRCQTFSSTHFFEDLETRQEALLEQAARLAERALADLPVSRPAWAIRRVTVQLRLASGESWQREGWLGDSPGQETLRALLGRLLAQVLSAGGGASAAGADEATDGDAVGVAEMTVSLLGLEPALGRQLLLFEAQETDRQWQQILSVLTRKHAARLVRAELVDPEAAILPERYAYRVLQP
ncbi:MAG: hypothetical protein ACOX2L_11535 [Anaerolineae bacterium]